MDTKVYDLYIAAIYNLSTFEIEERPIDPRVTIACIEFNRGIANIQELGEYLQEKYPNLKHIYFEQNFGMKDPNDTWKNWPTFYNNLGLETLVIDDQQSNYKPDGQFTIPDLEDLGEKGIIEYNTEYEWQDYNSNEYPCWIGTNVGNSYEEIRDRIPWYPGIKYQNHVVAVDNDGYLRAIIWENSHDQKYRIQKEEWALRETDPIYIRKRYIAAKAAKERRNQKREKQEMYDEDRNSSLFNGRMWIDCSYIYLTSAERNMFVNSSYESLITT